MLKIEAVLQCILLIMSCNLSLPSVHLQALAFNPGIVLKERTVLLKTCWFLNENKLEVITVFLTFLFFLKSAVRFSQLQFSTANSFLNLNIQLCEPKF